MKTTLNEKAEKIKKNITGTTEKSKQTIKEIIVANSRHINEAVNANLKVVESIKENFKQNEMQDTITDNLKQALLKSVELAEDTLDAIINSYARQRDLTIDLNIRLVDAVIESSPGNAEKFFQLIQDNFEKKYRMIVDNTNEIVESYNKHTNLAVNFNKKFADGVNIQIDNLLQVQDKSLDKFSNLASVWWKENHLEKVTV